MRHDASTSLGRIVPLARVCELSGVARSSVYARRSATVLAFPRRRGPRTAHSDAELTEAIRAVLAASPWTGEGYRKVWAKLRCQGVRSSQVAVFVAIDHATAEPVAAGLTVRHDHGSQYLSDAFQAELAFIRAPEGNGCAERVIRTLKEQLLWVKTFATGVV